MDPLAVLMSKVWTTPVAKADIVSAAETLKSRVQGLGNRQVVLPWIDEDHETSSFVRFWFGGSQIVDLRRIAFVLDEMQSETRGMKGEAAVDVLRLNLSRIIVTKEQAASLARDTSHSRPHRVATESNYAVWNGFDRSLKSLIRRLDDEPPVEGAEIRIGDARNLSDIQDGTVDAVVTSPPYLNAIDYLRGHRLSLVWLGRRISELRAIRSESIGAERGLTDKVAQKSAELTLESMGAIHSLPARLHAIVTRYAYDLASVTSEIARVTKSGGIATFVVGNSCISEVYIDNASGLAHCATNSGFEEISRSERDLPANSRYLPVTVGALGRRMRKEVVLSFKRSERIDVKTP
ncbi:MAG: hypothetical protein U1E50_12865 [Caulobacteraceae bacterium]